MSATLRPLSSPNKPDGDNGANGFHRINSLEKSEQNPTNENNERERRKAALKQKERRLNYILYLPILVLDLIIIGLCSWEVSPQVQDQVYTDGLGGISPLILLICTGLATIYATAVLLCTRFTKGGMAFWPRILVLLLYSLPSYLIGTLAFGTMSQWLPDFGGCSSGDDRLCPKLQAVEMTTVIFASFATILSVVDTVIVFKMRGKYKQLA